jgi:uncharacterized protein YkwD
MGRARPALALVLAVVGLGFAAGPAAAASCHDTTKLPETAGQLADARAATLCLVNKERTKRHLTALKRNLLLQKMGVHFAGDMVKRQFFDHTDPDGSTFSDRLGDFHWSGSTAGENIAWGSGGLGTPAKIVDAWMHSPGHRANILHASFRRAGVGVAAGAPTDDGGQDAATYSMEYDAP